MENMHAIYIKHILSHAKLHLTKTFITLYKNVKKSDIEKSLA